MSESGEDDEALVRALRSGDEDAGRRLYDRFAADVNRVLWRYRRGGDDHDDLVQKVFVRVFDGGVHRIRDGSALRSYVVGTAVNVARESARKGREVLDPEIPDPLAPRVDHPAREALLAFERALDGLKPEARLVFVLRYVDERTIPELAELIGCSQATVKRRLAKAEKAFLAVARRDPKLKERLAGSRWGTGQA